MTWQTLETFGTVSPDEYLRLLVETQLRLTEDASRKGYPMPEDGRLAKRVVDNLLEHVEKRYAPESKK